MADKGGYIGRSPGDSAVIIARQNYSPTGIQTDFTFNSGYTPGYVDVYLNGVRLIDVQDYTASTGNTVGLTSYANNGDIVEVIAYKAFNVGNVSDATSNFTVGGNLVVSGDTNVSGSSTFVDVNISGATTASGASYLTGASYLSNVTEFVSSGIVTVSNTTDSTSTTTGALLVNGGVGVALSMHVGGNLSVGGTLTYEDVTNVDAIGIVTAQSGVNIVGGGLTVTGVGTFFGRVLLGTTTEGEAAADDLTVYNSGNGGITIRNGTSSNGNIYFSDATSGTAEYAGYIQYQHANDALILASSSTERLRIASTGNVAIGTITASPANLTVYGDGTNDNKPATIYQNALSGGSSGNGFYVGINHDDVVGYVWNYENADMVFATNGTERLRIDSAGLVGIGTVNPTQLLSLHSTSPRILLTHATSPISNCIVDYASSGVLEVSVDDNDATANSKLQVRVDGATASLTLDSSSRLLLGTTTEGHADADNLTVSSSSRTGITIRSATDNTGNIFFSDATSGGGEYAGYVQYSHTSNYLLFGTNANDRVQIDTNGRVNIGSLSQRTIWGGNTAVQIEGLTGATSSVSIIRNSNDEWYPWLGFGKSRGTSDGDSTIIQDDDCLGVISWNAGDGNDMTSQGAAIYCDIDGTPGADDTPARLEFHTCADGASTPTERMRLDQGGNLILGGTSAQASDAVTLRQDGEVTAAGFYFSNNIGSAMNDTGIRRATTNTMVFDTNSTERLRITDTVTTVKNGFVVEHSDWNSIRAVNTNANTYGAYLDLVHQSASPADGDEAGEIRFLANDSAGGETVFGQVRVTCSDVTSGAEDGQWEFQLRNNDTLEDKLIITHAGKVHSKSAVQSGGNTTGGFQFDAVDTACVLGIQQPSSGSDANAAIQVFDGTSNNLRVNYSGLIKTSAGVDFSGAQTNSAGMTSETLDSYEEGTWTPTFGSAISVSSYSEQHGFYVKIGQQVWARFYLKTATGSSTTGDNLSITGLPFSSTATARTEGGGWISYNDGFLSTTDYLYTAALWVNTNNTIIQFHRMDTGTILTGSNCSPSNKYLIGAVMYQAA